MYLPAELIDEIISHLALHDEESLRNCSLVAKSWLDPCQRRLFRSIRITPDTCQLLLANISPTNAELLRHVRELAYVIKGKHGSWHPPCRIGDDLRAYLPSFSRLQRLDFGYVDIEPTILDHANLFTFQHALSSLLLVRVSITWTGFVTLLGYFPNLMNLKVREVSFGADICPPPHLPCALRGRLLVRCVKERDPVPFIDQFVGQKLEYEELVVMGDYDKRLVAAVEDNLKDLRITRCNSDLALDLSRCPELCQLDIAVLQPRKEEEVLISSITSTNLRKLVITWWISHIEWDFLLFNLRWISFDDVICGLVDRLEKSGYRHTLELEFRAEFVDLGGEVDHQEFMPKFKEKGRVRIVEVSSRKFREWP